MRAVGGNSASRICFTGSFIHTESIRPTKLHRSCHASQRPFMPESTNAPVDTSAASTYAHQVEHAQQAAALDVTIKQEIIGTQRRSRYLTFDEYVALQKQQQQAANVTANGSGPDSQATNEQPAATASDSGPKKRVPWNKGRKHSALTIARIIEGNNRARQRPEVRANYDAWNQTRIGVSLPEEHKANIVKRTAEGRLRRLQNSTPEELAARRAAISERSKTLWQDPEYVRKTTAAIRAAQERMRDKRQSSDRVEGTSTVKPRQRRSRVASTADAEQGQQQRPVSQPKPKKPTRREMVAAAEQYQQQLQQQVHRMLQTQQLITNTERTVLQLQANLAAFENNPQAYAMASQTMQKAQAHLEQARAQVQQLAQSLDEAGVQWNPSTGQITHIAHGPAAELLQKPAGSKQAKPRTRTVKDTSSSGIGADGSNDDGLVRSQRSRAPARGSPESDRSSGQPLKSLPGDVVPSRRRGQLADSGPQDAGQGSSSRNSPAAAAAEAAVNGGSRSGSGSDSSWSVVGSHLNGNRSNGAANGHTVQSVNGNTNGYTVDGEGSRFVTVQLQEATEDDHVQ